MGAAVDAFDPLDFGYVSAGIVAGAVKTPCAEIVPQFGLQLAPAGVAAPPGGKSVVSPATGCSTFHVGGGFTGGTFKNDAVNCTCCAGFNPTGTVTVRGVTDARMPVSSETTAVPFLLVAAVAAAVKVSVGIGLGKFASAGAVYVKTFVAAVGVLVQVPMLPPFTVWPLVQFASEVGGGLGFEVVGNGVY
jgi:hypothetical protein